MVAPQGAAQIKDWPEESQEAAQLVIDQYGEPHEATETLLIWHDAGPWKRILASKVFYQHDFRRRTSTRSRPSSTTACPRGSHELAQFDSSVVVERTAGEVSARCHDEQANFLALNLMHDIVTGEKTVQEARDYYAKEFADARRKEPTPYMEKLRFSHGDRSAADPDTSVLSDEDLQQAVEEGEQKG